MMNNLSEQQSKDIMELTDYLLGHNPPFKYEDEEPESEEDQ